MKTGLITSDTYKNHNTGNGHPEKIDRVTAIIDNFKKVDNKNLIWKKPKKFDEFFLNKTHSIEYINHVKQSFPKKGLVFLDGEYSFKLLDLKHYYIWWGAYLGMKKQILIKGRLSEVYKKIISRKKKAQTVNGWIMDTYLLKKID